MNVCIIQPHHSVDYADSECLFRWELDAMDRCDRTMDLIVLPEACDVPALSQNRTQFLSCVEAFANIARNNVDVIIDCSHQRSDTHLALEIISQFLAYNTNAYVLRASVSMDENSEIGGGSMVVAPTGQILLNMKSRVGMECVDIDTILTNDYNTIANTVKKYTLNTTGDSVDSCGKFSFSGVGTGVLACPSGSSTLDGWMIPHMRKRRKKCPSRSFFTDGQSGRPVPTGSTQCTAKRKFTATYTVTLPGTVSGHCPP